MDVWSWDSPVGMGLFWIMAGVAVVLLAVAVRVVLNGLPTRGTGRKTK